LFFDKDTFQEVQLFVEHRSSLFGLDQKKYRRTASSPVSANKRPRCFAAAQDFTSSGGSLGEMHARKSGK